MTHEVFSNHIGHASELLLAVDVKQGFIPHRNTMTYASRLRTFLNLVSIPRARGFDGPERGLFVTAIDRLQTLYLVRWTLFDDDKRLMLAVNFDHPIGPYIRRIVDEGGPLLDTILCHAEGYENSSTDLGYEGFLEFAQKHQIEADLFTASFPQLTSDDMNYLIGLEELQHSGAPDREIAEYSLESPGAQAHRTQNSPLGKTYQEQAIRTLRAVHYASKFFPEPDPENPNAAPANASKDHEFYKSFARFLMEQVDFKKIPDKDKAAFRAVLDWYGPTDLPEIRPRLTDRPPQKTLEDGAENDLQGGIVNSYKIDSRPTNLGATIFLRFENSRKGGEFLERIKPMITAHSATQTGAANDVRMNIALSYRGLKTLSLPEAQRFAFPADFREGAAARAGMIGDFGTNATDNWDAPLHDKDGHTIGSMDLETVDAVITLHTRVDEVARAHHGWAADHPLRQFWDGIDRTGVTVMSVERMVRYEETVSDQDAAPRMVGHFGFVDGISNPVVDGRNGVDGDHLDYAPLGSAVIGYDDDGSRQPPDLLRHGAFMVVRKMEQDVERFSAIADPIQELMVGREKNGDPLIKAAAYDRTKINDFDFKSDPTGVKCPFTSHVRRVNPRFKRGEDTVTGEVTHQDSPRILRRGYSYGPKVEEDAAAERGLMFICFNASIGEQFEVIQRWIGGGNPTGGFSTRNDALLGPLQSGKSRIFRYVDPTKPAGAQVIREDLGEDPFVTLKYSMYFFVPSITAIGEIAAHAKSAAFDDSHLIDKGEEIVRSLTCRDDWKAVLEDSDPRNIDKADAVMAFLTNRHGGVARIPLSGMTWPQSEEGFVLVTHPDHVMEVFDDTVGFSNRRYWKRMKDAIGPVYLGMDPEPQELSTYTGDAEDVEFETSTVGVYAKNASAVNPYLAFTTNSDARQKAVFKQMYAEAYRVLNAPTEIPDEPDPDVKGGGRRKLIDLEEWIGGVVAKFGLNWLGLPGDWLRESGVETPATHDEIITEYPHTVSASSDGAQKPSVPAPPGTPRAPDDFLEMAAYFFGPWPKDDTRARSVRKGDVLTRRVVAWLDKRQGKLLPQETLIGHLQRLGQGYSNGDLVRLALNSAIGLQAPTCASFAGVAYDWLKEGEFWRVQQDLRAAVANSADPDFATVKAILRDPMIRSMSRYAGPRHLHRVCAAPGVQIGGEAIDPGEEIVLAIGAAAQRRSDIKATEEVLFGGLNQASGAPVHACPGRDLAMTLMMVAMSALMLTGYVVRNSSLTAYVRMPPPHSTAGTGGSGV